MLAEERPASDERSCFPGHALVQFKATEGEGDNVGNDAEHAYMHKFQNQGVAGMRHAEEERRAAGLNWFDMPEPTRRELGARRAAKTRAHNTSVAAAAGEKKR